MPCIGLRSDALFANATLFDGAARVFEEPGVEPNYAPSRTVRVEHMHVQLSLEPVECIYRGSVRVRFTCLPTFDGTLVLDFEDGSIDGVTDEQGAELAWSLGEETLEIRGVEASGVVLIEFSGADPRRGLYFTGPVPHSPDRQHMAWTQFQDEDGHFVFPCHDHPRVKHAWTVELDAPAGYTLLGNGAQIEHGERDGRAYARFEQAEPMPVYLFTAVAAKLSVIESSWRGLPVRYLVPVGQEEAVVRSMGKTPLMMDAFSDITGVDYPWPRYDQVVVHDFIFGGMENTACTTMTDVLLVDAKATLEWDPDGLVCHELAHQWFGDLVTCQDWSQGWLNESWATFMERVWWESDRDEAEATWYGFNMARQYMEEAAGRYRRSIVSYRFREPIDVFDRHLYQKGGCVLATLRTQLGPEAFWAGCKLYLERHGQGTVHTTLFQRAYEDATGTNLDGFVQQWLFSAGHPVVTVKLSQEGGLLTASVKQTQSGDDVPDAFAFPLRLELVGEDGSRKQITLAVSERERAWAVPLDGPLSTVRVDAGFGVLADITLDAPRPMLEALLRDECPVLAARAAKALLTLSTHRAVDAVIDALLDHPLHMVRAEIAALLGERGGDDARDALLEALASDPDPRVRRAVASALGGFREEDVATALLGALDADPETWQLHGSLLRSLGATRDPRAIGVLKAHMGTVSWASWVTQGALAGLGATHDPAVIDTLAIMSHPDEAPRHRSAAAAALGELGDHVQGVRSAVVERLIEMTSEPGFRAQLMAIGALGRVRDAASIPTLARIHRSAPDGRMRRSAYEALTRVRAGRTTEAGLAGLRTRLDGLAEENHKLRARLNKLERL